MGFPSIAALNFTSYNWEGDKFTLERIKQFIHLNQILSKLNLFKK